MNTDPKHWETANLLRQKSKRKTILQAATVVTSLAAVECLYDKVPTYVTQLIPRLIGS